jgi:hypothetical protein
MLHFHATDDALGDDGAWRATRTAAGVTWEHAHGQSDVAVRGPAADLLLVLNRRWSPTRLEVHGDAGLFEHWLEYSKFGAPNWVRSPINEARDSKRIRSSGSKAAPERAM